MSEGNNIEETEPQNQEELEGGDEERDEEGEDTEGDEQTQWSDSDEPTTMDLLENEEYDEFQRIQENREQVVEPEVDEEEEEVVGGFQSTVELNTVSREEKRVLEMSDFTVIISFYTPVDFTSLEIKLFFENKLGVEVEDFSKSGLYYFLKFKEQRSVERAVEIEEYITFALSVDRYNESTQRAWGDHAPKPMITHSRVTDEKTKKKREEEEGEEEKEDQEIERGEEDDGELEDIVEIASRRMKKKNKKYEEVLDSGATFELLKKVESDKLYGYPYRTLGELREEWKKIPKSVAHFERLFSMFEGNMRKTKDYEYLSSLKKDWKLREIRDFCYLSLQYMCFLLFHPYEEIRSQLPDYSVELHCYYVNQVLKCLTRLVICSYRLSMWGEARKFCELVLNYYEKVMNPDTEYNVKRFDTLVLPSLIISKTYLEDQMFVEAEEVIKKALKVHPEERRLMVFKNLDIRDARELYERRKMQREKDGEESDSSSLLLDSFQKGNLLKKDDDDEEEDKENKIIYSQAPDLNTNEDIKFIPKIGDKVTALLYLEEEQYLVIGTNGGYMCIFDYINGRKLVQLVGHTDTIYHIKSFGRKTFISCGYDGSVFGWKIFEEEEEEEEEKEEVTPIWEYHEISRGETNPSIDRLLIIDSGKRFLTISDSNSLSIIDVQELKDGNETKYTIVLRDRITEGDLRCICPVRTLTNHFITDYCTISLRIWKILTDIDHFVGDGKSFEVVREIVLMGAEYQVRKIGTFVNRKGGNEVIVSAGLDKTYFFHDLLTEKLIRRIKTLNDVYDFLLCGSYIVSSTIIKKSISGPGQQILEIFNYESTEDGFTEPKILVRRSQGKSLYGDWSRLCWAGQGKGKFELVSTFKSSFVLKHELVGIEKSYLDLLERCGYISNKFIGNEEIVDKGTMAKLTSFAFSSPIFCFKSFLAFQ